LPEYGDEFMKLRITFVIIALAGVLAAPFALKPQESLLGKADDLLVVISPHNEAVRYEFTIAFMRHYRELTGRSILIDWRLPGGTSEISRYLDGEYLGAFERAWTNAGYKWSSEVAAAFNNPNIILPSSLHEDTQSQAARRFFLESSVGIGIDVFFGGGTYDFKRLASAGCLVPSDILLNSSDWFQEGIIPWKVSGEEFYDKKARWIGACLSSFGICYNTDTLRRLGFNRLPASWSDLGDPRLFKQVALADPSKSGSAAKAFEMVIQQQMQNLVKETGRTDREVIAMGWAMGLRIIQSASANARYFTDAASKVPIDVSLGDAAIGMCIDFYGRFQSEAVRLGDAPSRLQYFTPVGGSSVGVDPIGLLRGARNRNAAEMFIAFVLSPEGQKLWNFKVGTPGGPQKYALRRLPVRKELYDPVFAEYRSDPTVQPYEDAKMFHYQDEWTSPLFRVIAFVVQVMCIDLHHEQVEAWQALVKKGFPPEAYRVFSNMEAVNYQAASSRIKNTLSSRNRIKEVRLAKVLTEHFRRQYRETVRLAHEDK
jgi:iron(III) transport system substrate-binding protein